MINEYCTSVEAATVFLKALTDRNCTQIAKAQRGNSINFQGLQFHASMFGYMALKFGECFILQGKDKEPSVAKTVKRVVACIKELFFDVAHDNIRNACVLSLYEMLENCFVNKRYGKDNKKAKDLIFQPLFEELQNPKERVSR